MAILSVDLAYRNYRDIGVAVLEWDHNLIRCELISIPLSGLPSPGTLAEYLSGFCVQREIRVLVLDGPQGWKAKNNGLEHSRRCEKELNTPAKTGEPMFVKPTNYHGFVSFSIATYDALEKLGWERLSAARCALGPTQRVLVESFPLSAWRSLRIHALPAKAKTRSADLTSRLEELQELFPLSLTGIPTHDQLQALVSGLAGLSLEMNKWEECMTAGLPPAFVDQHWREGFIVNPLRPHSAER